MKNMSWCLQIIHHSYGKNNHLQKLLGRGYVNSQDGIYIIYDTYIIYIYIYISHGPPFFSFDRQMIVGRQSHHPRWTSCAAKALGGSVMAHHIVVWVVVWNIYVHPEFGKMIQFDEHIFQMGWVNHQLDHIVVVYGHGWSAFLLVLKGVISSSKVGASWKSRWVKMCQGACDKTWPSFMIVL